MHPVPTDRRAADRSRSTPRRTRLRLRELCDEVLASYRAASGRAPLTDDDRVAASALLDRVAPALRR
jgi:hypothetical protein